ncbi:MAG: aldo/keto reductase [Planctomycetaceae bacterium]
MTNTLTLSNGSSLPSVGLGLWKIDKAETASVVQQAIELGYRHFDAACDYGNEVEAGEGLNAAIKNGTCSRDDLWVTSKLWNTYHAAEHVRPACERSLKDLGLDYLDLYLVHFPIAQRFVPFEERYPPEWVFDPAADAPKVETVPIPISETWQAMEELVAAGLVKTIGICNFGVSLIRDLQAHATIQPAVLQIESHPYLTQDKLLQFCDEQNIAVTAFSPLGALSYLQLNMATQQDSVLETESVRAASARLGKTPAQVVLRWGIQRGTAIVPKTSRPERLAENLALFDFELTDDEMSAISSLDQNRRFNDPGVFCESAFGTFFPIYE